MNTNILNALRGENIIGKNSGASAVFVSTNGSNEVNFVYQNENTFEVGEEVTFEETNVQGVVQTFIPGDKDIQNDFEFDPGQEMDYVDFSYIVRKQGTEAPTRRITVIYLSLIHI